MTTAHDLYLKYFHKWPVKVSFCTYLFVFMHDRMPRTFLWLWTCLNTLTDKIITWTIFAAQFTSSLFPHLGKTLGCQVWHLPQVFICHWLSVDQILSLQAQPSMSDYAFFSKDPNQWEEAYQSLWGHHDICPTLEWFHVTSITQSELSSFTSLKAWGNPEKFRSHIAFLLILTEECTVGDRVYGLSMMWVHPYQARVSTVEESVKQLTPLISTGHNCPYALVWLNGDAHHVPLPRAGHLSILVEGSTSSVACRRISQLEVCQLLSSGSQAIYLAGFNGCEVSVITSLSKLLAKGTTMLGGEPIYLPVDILQLTMKGQEPKALSLGSLSVPIPTTSPIRAPLPTVEGQVSMTTEVRELLSQVVLDTSGHASGSTTPKRLEPMVLVTPLPPKPEDFSKLVDTPSQVMLIWMTPPWRRSMPPPPLQ